VHCFRRPATWASLAVLALLGLPGFGRSAAPKIKQVVVIRLYDFSIFEAGERSLKEGLKASGLVEGKDFVLKVKSAQGDPAALATMMDASVSAGVDVIVVLGTEVLQTALLRIKETPVVFQVVVDPFAVGAGRTATEHQSNVTGVYLSPEVARKLNEQLVAYIRDLQPNAKKLGFLFTTGSAPSEMRSGWLREDGQKAGFEVEAMGLASSADVADALNGLTANSIDAFVIVPGDVPLGSLATIRSKLEELAIPIYSTTMIPETIGALLTLAADYRVHGVECGKLVSQILRGAKPATLPFVQPQNPAVVVLNRTTARRLKITVSPSVAKAATRVVGN
jgi:ABC-type uncharacterized transport system substrate-binding protein